MVVLIRTSTTRKARGEIFDTHLSHRYWPILKANKAIALFARQLVLKGATFEFRGRAMSTTGCAYAFFTRQLAFKGASSEFRGQTIALFTRQLMFKGATSEF